MYRRLWKYVGVIAVGLTCLLKAPVVNAQDDDAQAKTLYEEGKSHFEAERYNEAMAAFTEAYNLTTEPNLLFNLAACAERLGEKERAIAYYEVYLEELPDAPDADDVRSRIAVLKGEAPAEPADKPKAETPAKTEPPPPAIRDDEDPRAAEKTKEEVDPVAYYNLDAERNSVKKPIWPKFLIGVGGMLVAGGVITSILAYNGYKGLQSSCEPNCTDDKLSATKSLAIASDVQFFVGGATLVAGVVGLVLTNKRYAKEPVALQVVPIGHSTGGALSIQGRF